MPVFRVEFSKNNLSRSLFHDKNPATFKVVSDGVGDVVATPGDNSGFPEVVRYMILGNPGDSLGNPDSGGFIRIPSRGFMLKVTFTDSLNFDAIEDGKGFRFYFYREGATRMSHYVN